MGTAAPLPPSAPLRRGDGHFCTRSRQQQHRAAERCAVQPVLPSAAPPVLCPLCSAPLQAAPLASADQRLRQAAASRVSRTAALRSTGAPAPVRVLACAPRGLSRRVRSLCVPVCGGIAGCATSSRRVSDARSTTTSRTRPAARRPVGWAPPTAPRRGRWTSGCCRASARGSCRACGRRCLSWTGGTPRRFGR